MIKKLRENRVSRTYLGGSSIDRFYGKKECKNSFYPEDWTASTVSAYNSTEDKPEGLGMTEDGTAISELTRSEKPNMLVKLLDSAERLVIQAHPTVPFAKEFLGSDHGKTECWYFLDSAPDACVYIGFREGISRKEWERAFYENDSAKMLSMLHRIPVKKGDFVFVDGGVPHAIGAGCFMVELQEPSDLMVVNERFTPSGREIPEQRLHMGLGYEKMFDVYDYTCYSEKAFRERYCPSKRAVLPGAWEVLGKSLTDKFSMYLMEGSTEFPLENKYAVAVITEGEGELCGIGVSRGDRLFISDENKLQTRGEDLKIILCTSN